jgi:kynurenine formamidase
VVVPIIAKPGQEISLGSFLDAGMTNQEQDIVFLNTGWAGHMNDPMYYLNPYPSQELADFLVKHHVKILGVDCITVDMPPSQRPKGFTYPIHQTLLSHNTLIIENLSDLSAVSGCRVFIWAFPLKIKGSDAGHVRVVAQIL